MLEMILYELLACWGPRSTSPEDDARSLSLLLADLRVLGPLWTGWFSSEEDGMVPLPAEDGPERVRAVAEHLERCAETWDHGELRYRARRGYLTNGRPPRSEVRLEIATGIDTPSTMLWFANSLRIRFRAPAAEGALAEPDAAEWLLERVALGYDPVWGCIRAGDALTRTIREEWSGTPAVGWWTYLRAPDASSAALPPPAERRNAAGGVIVRAGPGWLDPNDAAQVGCLERVNAALKDGGSLRAQVDVP